MNAIVSEEDVGKAVQQFIQEGYTQITINKDEYGNWIVRAA